MDIYRDIAAYYDCEHADFHDDIDFYLNLIHEGPVLEVGAGTGRVVEPLARAGLEVWGIDPSPAMLRRARMRLDDLPNIHLLEGSIQEARLEQKFATALLPLNTLWHIPDLDEQVAALRMVRAHLDPGGMVVVDLSNPLAMSDRGAQGEVRQRFRTECNGQTVTGFSAGWDDEAEQTLTLSLTYEVAGPEGGISRSFADLTLRYIYRPELELMLRLAGFQVHQIYGSYDLDLYSSQSPGLIAVASS